MLEMTRREKDALLRNGRQTTQERLDKVPSTRAGVGRHMAQERELLAKLVMIDDEIRKQYDKLDSIFQQIIDSEYWHEANKIFDELDEMIKQLKETEAKIEEQREKQVLNTFQLEEPW